MRLRFVIPAYIAASFVAGCAQNVESFAERHTTPAEREYALGYLQQLQRGEVDSAFAVLEPELKSPEARRQLTQISSMFAVDPIHRPKLIGVQVNKGPSWRTVNLTWEYESGAQWVVTNVQARYGNAGVTVSGVNAHRVDHSLAAGVAFTLRDKSTVHVVWLIIAIVIPVVCVLTALLVATARGMPKRKRWVIASLVGVGRFSLNWSTGAISVNPIYVLLFGAAATRGPATPWIISVSVPLGAILALRKYRDWRRSQVTSVTSDVEPAV
jgi:hypothetical protein